MQLSHCSVASFNQILARADAAVRQLPNLVSVSGVDRAEVSAPTAAAPGPTQARLTQEAVAKAMVCTGWDAGKAPEQGSRLFNTLAVVGLVHGAGLEGVAASDAASSALERLDQALDRAKQVAYPGATGFYDGTDVSLAMTKAMVQVEDALADYVAKVGPEPVMQEVFTKWIMPATAERIARNFPALFGAQGEWKGACAMEELLERAHLNATLQAATTAVGSGSSASMREAFHELLKIPEYVIAPPEPDNATTGPTALPPGEAQSDGFGPGHGSHHYAPVTVNATGGTATAHAEGSKELADALNGAHQVNLRLADGLIEANHSLTALLRETMNRSVGLPGQLAGVSNPHSVVHAVHTQMDGLDQGDSIGDRSDPGGLEGQRDRSYADFADRSAEVAMAEIAEPGLARDSGRFLPNEFVPGASVLAPHENADEAMRGDVLASRIIGRAGEGAATLTAADTRQGDAAALNDALQTVLDDLRGGAVYDGSFYDGSFARDATKLAPGSIPQAQDEDTAVQAAAIQRSSGASTASMPRVLRVAFDDGTVPPEEVARRNELRAQINHELHARWMAESQGLRGGVATATDSLENDAGHAIDRLGPAPSDESTQQQLQELFRRSATVRWNDERLAQVGRGLYNPARIYTDDGSRGATIPQALPQPPLTWLNGNEDLGAGATGAIQEAGTLGSAQSIDRDRVSMPTGDSSLAARADDIRNAIGQSHFVPPHPQDVVHGDGPDKRAMSGREQTSSDAHVTAAPWTALSEEVRLAARRPNGIATEFAPGSVLWARGDTATQAVAMQTSSGASTASMPRGLQAAFDDRTVPTEEGARWNELHAQINHEPQARWMAQSQGLGRGVAAATDSLENDAGRASDRLGPAPSDESTQQQLQERFRRSAAVRWDDERLAQVGRGLYNPTRIYTDDGSRGATTPQRDVVGGDGPDKRAMSGREQMSSDAHVTAAPWTALSEEARLEAKRPNGGAMGVQAPATDSAQFIARAISQLGSQSQKDESVGANSERPNLKPLPTPSDGAPRTAQEFYRHRSSQHAGKLEIVAKPGTTAAW